MPLRAPTRRAARPAALSLEEARRRALAAQGLTEPRPRGEVGPAHVRRTVDRLGLVQLDSVQVLVRSHYLPVFSRLGPYDRGHLDRLAYRDRVLFEYWGHEASLLPVRLHPLLRWRMARPAWPAVAALLRARPDAAEAVLRRIDAEGPLTASDVGGDPRQGSWWGWGPTKHVLEWLFRTGRLTAADRRGFERVYDRAERVLPREVLDAPTPSPDDARRELLLLSAKALGVATARELADYYRLHKPTARALVEGLAAEGRLRRVRVEGVPHDAFLLPDAPPAPRRVAARALLAPFDPLVFERDRTERLFGFRYRLEIYVPAGRRVFGYYVLPFLLDDALVARVDLKADRAREALVVRAAHLEPGRDAERVAEALAAELADMARWLALPRVVVERRGVLAAPLRAAVRRGASADGFG
jgi:uncharacterized protein YcaQ